MNVLSIETPSHEQLHQRAFLVVLACVVYYALLFTPDYVIQATHD
jgi:preprotein translocase subunit SecE